MEVYIASSSAICCWLCETRERELTKKEIAMHIKKFILVGLRSRKDSCWLNYPSCMLQVDYYCVLSLNRFLHSLIASKRDIKDEFYSHLSNHCVGVKILQNQSNMNDFLLTAKNFVISTLFSFLP